MRCAQMKRKSINEAKIIERFFGIQGVRSADLLGIGDDAAVLPETKLGKRCVMTTDTLLVNTHFFPDVSPYSLGHKSLAVNLSDLAAMGAKPEYALMSLTMPKLDDKWMAKFSGGFFDLAQNFDVKLIGGDLVRGPLSITVTAIGYVNGNEFLRRDSAKDGDDIWISGIIGGAAFALDHRKKKVNYLPKDKIREFDQILDEPMPRVILGQELLGVANSAIDISDGFIRDINRILVASKLGGEIYYEDIPRVDELSLIDNETDKKRYLLCGGDEYELAFTAPASNRSKIEELSKTSKVECTRVGIVVAGNGLKIFDKNGKKISIKSWGFDHFE